MELLIIANLKNQPLYPLTNYSVYLAMIMKPDIRNRQNIEILIEEFYRKALRDPIIGSFFTEPVKTLWHNQFSKICDFWESSLFGTSDYRENPMDLTKLIGKNEKLKPVHFQRWLSIFDKTIIENFEGPKAEEAMVRAKNISVLMQLKLQRN